MRKMSLIGNNEITLNNKSDCDRVVEDTIADLKELLEELTKPPEFASDNSSDYDDDSELYLRSLNYSGMDEPIMPEIWEFSDKSIPFYTHPLQMRNDWNEGLKHYIYDHPFQRLVDNGLFPATTTLPMGKENESTKDEHNQYAYTANNPDRVRNLGRLTADDYENQKKQFKAIQKLLKGIAKNTFINGRKWSGTYYSPYSGYEGVEVTREFKEKVYSICDELNINPDDLMTLMAVESRIATCKSPESDAVGLIQFAGQTPEILGTTAAELANMDGIQQLDLVKDYFELFLNTFNAADSRNIIDLYSLMFVPSKEGFGENDNFIITSKGEREYSWNPGLDVDKDGNITRGDLRKHIAIQMEDYNKNKR